MYLHYYGSKVPGSEFWASVPNMPAPLDTTPKWSISS